MSKLNYRVIGVMSGTSLDGIDLVLANFQYKDHWTYSIDTAQTVPYSQKWKSILSGLTQLSTSQVKDVDAEYSSYLAKVINNFISHHGIKSFDFISSHGHTALHQPENNFTYQIGNLQVLSDSLKSKVICDFRVQDVELGGQGAPLVPIGDQLLFNNYDYCLNLGGFANVSFKNQQQRIAFDICPVNIVLNHYVSNLNLEYDDRGKIAKEGLINEELLSELNSNLFYSESAPKSLGFEWVEKNIIPVIQSFNLETKDILRTFVEHIAIQISKVIHKKNTQVLVTGGGAYNDFLITRISHLSKSKLMIPDKHLIEFKEALIFAFLGVLKDRNETNCLSSVTGAKKDHSSGRILLPKNTL